jgi:hypothetical protein
MRTPAFKYVFAGLAELGAIVVFVGMILVWADALYRL